MLVKAIDKHTNFASRVEKLHCSIFEAISVLLHSCLLAGSAPGR